MARTYFKKVTKAGQRWFGDKPLREQWIIAVLAVFGFAWIMFVVLIEPVSVTYEENQRRLNRLMTENAQLDREISNLSSRLQVNPNQELEQQERQFSLQAERLQRQIGDIIQFNQPEALVLWMQQVLEGTSSRTSGGQVTLQSFVILPPERFLESRVDVNIARHNVVVTIEGRYFAVRDYLSELQQLPYGSYWEGIRYEVTEYPNAKVTLHLYTLTQDRSRS